MTMEIIWKLLCKTGIRNIRPLFLSAATLISGLAGFLVWYALHFIALNDIYWALCFVGYPACFVGILGGSIFLWKKEDC